MKKHVYILDPTLEGSFIHILAENNPLEGREAMVITDKDKPNLKVLPIGVDLNLVTSFTNLA